MILKYSVGLDVSSKDIKACISIIDELQSVKVKSSCTILNTKKGYEDLSIWINKWRMEKDKPVSICMEATGVYHENCAYYLHAKAYRVSIILPNKAKSYLQSLGLKSKNDSIDAKGLSQMGAEQQLKQWEPIGTFFYTLRTLTRHYQCIQEQITSEQNRLHASSHSAFQNKLETKQLTALIKFLKKQMATVVEEIKKHIQSNATLSLKFDGVCAIYGISTISAATVIAETNGFELFENYKQVVSYAGYDVVENQSGNRVGKTKISKKGNSRIRRILHMPALVAKGQEGSNIANLYNRVVERSGVKMKGVVAAQKKLLLMIYYVWKKDLDYKSNYTNIQNSKYTNIQEEEQVPTSPFKCQEPNITTKKVVTPSVTTQGKHPTSYRSMPPLRDIKVKKKSIKKSNKFVGS